MPSRDDVARLAGVSGATVSYVLNNTPGVKVRPETRERVLKAAATLRYQPSQAARSLVTGHYNQIGVLLPPGRLATAHYHQGIFNGVWDAASQRGYRLAIDSWSPERLSLSFLAERFVDGLIAPGIGPETFTPEVRERFRLLQIPVVVIGSGSWSEDFHTVDVDNLLIGRQAAEHLLAHGHRRVVCFGGNAASRSVERRRSGFIQAMAAAGIEVGVERCIDSDPVSPSADALAATLLRDRTLNFTAAFCYNDRTAHTLYRAAIAAGMRVPDDLSLIGIDDEPALRLAGIELTTFRQPLDIMGQRAVELVLDPTPQPTHEFLDHHFIPGRTVATAPPTI